MRATALLRDVLARVFQGPGASAIASVLERLVNDPPGAFAAVTYHRVDDPGAKPWLYPLLLSATPAAFEAQIEMLATHYQPVGLTELLAAHRGDAQLPRRAILVTFDDAYSDFRDTAWPIMKRHAVPATLFVPTAYPDAEDGGFWWDRLWQAIMEAPQGAVDTPIGVLELADDPTRRDAARSLVEFHKELAHDATLESVAALTGRLRSGRATSDVLGWKELRSLSAEGVHLAAHSRTHPLLTRIPPNRLREEVEGSRSDLERELPGAHTTVFAYPAGQHDDRTRTALSELGFELAFTTERGVNSLGASDPLRLRRVNVGRRGHGDLIRAQLAIYRLRYRGGRF